MIPEETRSRRDLLATVTGGALLGALWGAAFPIVATERRPTIAVVGHRNAQVVLIDSSARALLLIGEPDDELMDVLPAIMTVFRQRIDLLVATPRVLAQRAGILQQRWHFRHALALGGDAPLPSGIPATVVTDSMDVSLHSDTRLALRIGHRDDWRSDASPVDQTMWCATLHAPAGTVTIAPDSASISAIGPAASTLMIIPNAPAHEILAVSPAAALAVNYDGDSIPLADTSGPAVTRIYPQDVARIVIASDGIELPVWTTILPTGSIR